MRRKCAAHLRIICAIIRGCLFLDFLVIVPAHLGAYRVHHSCVDITARTGERFRRRQLVIHAVSYAACPNLVTAAERGMYRVQVAQAPRRHEVAEFIDICCHPYTDECKDERIYFGLSEDGLNFSSLNDEKPVLESKLGTHGLRDPFIIRSHEGDKFYLIATDLTVAGVTQDGVTYPGQGWGENQTNGSQSIMVWESEDLVN